MGQFDPARGGRIVLVETPADVARMELRDPGRAAFVTQTTLSVDDTARIVEALRARFPALATPRKEDICYATQNRQDAVKKLATLCEVIVVVGSKKMMEFDDAHPTMTLALGDRYRLHAMGFGLSYRPSITIRQHTLTDVTLKDLVRGGMMPEELGRLLHAAVLGRKSMVIAGDQGAGKTTLLRALIDAIPDNERFGTLETDYELLTHLQPHRRNMLALQARVGMGDGQAQRVGGVGSGQAGEVEQATHHFLNLAFGRAAMADHGFFHLQRGVFGHGQVACHQGGNAGAARLAQ